MKRDVICNKMSYVRLHHTPLVNSKERERRNDSKKSKL